MFSSYSTTVLRVDILNTTDNCNVNRMSSLQQGETGEAKKKS